MSDPRFPRLDITPVRGRLNESLIALVDRIPEDQLNWSPRRDLWNFRGTLLHIADARDNWLRYTVKDGEEPPAVWGTTRTRREIQREFRRTWERLQRFLGNEELLNRSHDDDGEAVTGHWIAFHLLEHDIHHRADIFHYLALLEIDPGDVGTP